MTIESPYLVHDMNLKERLDASEQECANLRARLKLATEELNLYSQLEAYIDEGKVTALRYGVRTVSFFKGETWCIGDRAKDFFQKLREMP